MPPRRRPDQIPVDLAIERDRVIQLERQFDEDEVVNEDGVEGDVGSLLIVRPAVVTIIDDFIPEIDEEKCYSVPKFDKEVVLGRGDTVEVGRGDTTEVQGTTMVEMPVCLTPHASFATIANVDEHVVDEKLGIKTEKHLTPYRLCKMNQRMKVLEDEVAKYNAEIRWSAMVDDLGLFGDDGGKKKNLWFDGGGRGVDDEEMGVVYMR
ncbi:hypothetical protein LWI28_026805 [Acer negundo]|uniref:Uncharacterized protein n=1 Tax=Acer negundo TaxID=4023 RepID=A0AAD5ISN6_ACENE|nr:hypothetical protein LWI28_026805 [Acer negundo]